MAMYSFRLRRTLTALSSLHRSLSAIPTIPAVSSPSSSSSSFLQSPQSLISIHQSRTFRSSPTSLFSSRSTTRDVYQDGAEITPDTVLFEGCDYNHWLITMDFPKDPKPTAEEMVQTYVQTCAKGLNISVEEAKQKIYACSTTTYQGFQALMTEEESEKFKNLPGVVFVLPDSYIDPVNKEYGGDKYINGTIIPRPPPVQYGRTGGRFRDRNRSPDQPRYDRQGGPMPNQQGNPQYNQQGSMQGDGRNYGPPQNYPQPNYGSPPMNNRDYAPGGRDTYQADRRGPPPSYQGNYNQGVQGNYPQERRDFPQGDRREYASPGQRDYAPPGQRDYAPPGQRDYAPPGQRDYAPPGQRDYAPPGQRDYAPPGQRDFRGDNQNYAPIHGETYGQGASSGHGQGVSSGHGQGVSSGYNQGYPTHGGGQRFSQVDQRNVQGEQRNYVPTGQTGTDQGRY